MRYILIVRKLYIRERTDRGSIYYLLFLELPDLYSQWSAYNLIWGPEDAESDGQNVVINIKSINRREEGGNWPSHGSSYENSWDHWALTACIHWSAQQFNCSLQPPVNHLITKLKSVHVDTDRYINISSKCIFLHRHWVEELPSCR